MGSFSDIKCTDHGLNIFLERKKRLIDSDSMKRFLYVSTTTPRTPAYSCKAEAVAYRAAHSEAVSRRHGFVIQVEYYRLAILNGSALLLTWVRDCLFPWLQLKQEQLRQHLKG